LQIDSPSPTVRGTSYVSIILPKHPYSGFGRRRVADWQKSKKKYFYMLSKWTERLEAGIKSQESRTKTKDKRQKSKDMRSKSQEPRIKTKDKRSKIKEQRD